MEDELDEKYDNKNELKELLLKELLVRLEDEQGELLTWLESELLIWEEELGKSELEETEDELEKKDEYKSELKDLTRLEDEQGKEVEEKNELLELPIELVDEPSEEVELLSGLKDELDEEDDELILELGIMLWLE